MITVRKARISDIPAIKKINKFGDMLERFSGLDRLDSSLKDSSKYWRRNIFCKDKWLLVAEDGSGIVGFIAFEIQKREPYFAIKKVGYIDLVEVAENARGKGISRLLMSEAYSILKRKGIRSLKLSVHTDNTAARKVWERHGFSEYRIDMWKQL